MLLLPAATQAQQQIRYLRVSAVLLCFDRYLFSGSPGGREIRVMQILQTGLGAGAVARRKMPNCTRTLPVISALPTKYIAEPHSSWRHLDAANNAIPEIWRSTRSYFLLYQTRVPAAAVAPACCIHCQSGGPLSS